MPRQILLQSFGWQCIFLINVPIGVVALIYGIRVLPQDEHEEAGKLDIVGLVLAAAGTVSLIYGLSDAARLGNLSRVGSGGAIAMGLVLLAAFVGWSLHSPYPVLDLTLFRHRGYAAVTMASLATGAAMFASMVIAPLYFQVVRGEDATRTGLLLAPTSLGVAAVISTAGRMTDRFGGGRVAVTGLLIGCASLLPYTAFTEHTPYLLIVSVATIRGVGFGAIGLPLFAVAFSMLEEDQIRDGSAQLNIVQRIGGSIGTAVATVILQQALIHHTVKRFCFQFIFLIPELQQLRADQREQFILEDDLFSDSRDRFTGGICLCTQCRRQRDDAHETTNNLQFCGLHKPGYLSETIALYKKKGAGLRTPAPMGFEDRCQLPPVRKGTCLRRGCRASAP